MLNRGWQKGTAFKTTALLLYTLGVNVCVSAVETVFHQNVLVWVCLQSCFFCSGGGKQFLPVLLKGDCPVSYEDVSLGHAASDLQFGLHFCWCYPRNCRHDGHSDVEVHVLWVCIQASY